jgi:DNA-binding GntR family transcriptional regulator
MSSISRIEFSPDLSEQVHQRLLDAICNGDLPPGARLLSMYRGSRCCRRCGC